MSHPMIKVEHLSKQYKIGMDRTYKTLQDSITSAVKSPLSLFKKGNNNNTFWALKDVSFDVEKGEVIGIIGRNGAGKSTLLKILSRITEPTEGRITMRGRVASLLEVGTGFHPQLTGRENIYLNGSILGMKKREIDSRFDEIVQFAEIEKFLDTPVKHYSSGMYVRLAFAVAAHLEPEILLVDEVLAVGDIKFQKKCMERMSVISKSEGRTILFVSHNLDAVESLCSKAILLIDGKSTYFDKTSDAINAYTANILTFENPVSFENIKGFGDMCGGRLLKLGVFNAEGTPSNSFPMWDKMYITLEVDIESANIGWQISIVITDKSQKVVSILNNEWNGSNLNLTVGRNIVKVSIPKIDLFPGTYSLTPMIRQEGLLSTHKINNALSFEVKEPVTKTGYLNISKYSTGNQVWINHIWES